MKKANQEIEKIQELYSETIKLAEQDLIIPALMYCRKIVEGILLIIQNKERLQDSGNMRNHLRDLGNHIRQKYDISDAELFFEYLRTLQQLGTLAAHFSIDEPKINISKDNIIELLRSVFIWFTEFVTKFHQNRESIDLFFSTNKYSLPFCLKYLEIENYQSLKKIEIDAIPVDSQFIVLTGDNGEGKTSILQAIAIGMYGDYDEYSNLVLCNKKDVNISIEAKYKNQTIFNEYKGFGNQFSNIEKNINLIAYGASRLQLQSSESQDVKNSRQSNIYGIFKTNNILQNIEYWIKMQMLNNQKERIDLVKNLLIKLMPSISEIKVGHQVVHNKINTSKGIFIRNTVDEFPVTYIENGIELQSEQLSAGNKSILAMIGDMIIRLYDSQPDTINPKDLYGIVLIDELETHLHPKWQRELPKLLSENFPLVQFIVSTHSAIVFLGMPKNSVFYNISKNEEKQTIVKKLDIDIENVLPNQILTSALFGMENIRNVNNKGIENLSVETEHEIQERLQKEKLLKELSNGFKFQLPKE